MLGIPNAIIKVPVSPSEPVSFDPYTGEPIFSLLTFETVNATLEEKTPPKEQSLPGQDTAIAYLAGRLKGKAPTGLKARNFYDITISLQTQTLEGRFYLVATPKSRLGLDSVFGTAIYGWLVS